MERVSNLKKCHKSSFSKKGGPTPDIKEKHPIKVKSTWKRGDSDSMDTPLNPLLLLREVNNNYSAEV